MDIVVAGKCAVCSAARNHQFYYGAPVCAACKAFFLRCVRNRRNSIPVSPCSFKNACEISDKKSRFLCPPCRWQKCLEFGMKECLVKRIRPAKNSTNNKLGQKFNLRPFRAGKNVHKCNFHNKGKDAKFCL